MILNCQFNLVFQSKLSILNILLLTLHFIIHMTGLFHLFLFYYTEIYLYIQLYCIIRNINFKNFIGIYLIHNNHYSTCQHNHFQNSV